MNALNQHCPNVHIFATQFRSWCSLNRYDLADWFLLVSLLTTATHKHWKEHDLIVYFHFLLSWEKHYVLICSRYVDVDSQRYSHKNIFQNYATNLHKGVPAGALPINSMHAHSTTPLIALPCFHLLNCKRLLEVVWIPQWYFVTYATRIINIGTFKMFKQGFF